MINQLKVEFFKAGRFWLMYLAFALLAVAGFLFGFIKVPQELLSGEVFSGVVGDTSFLFIIALVSAWFVGNDFYCRTIHNEIKTGHTRASVIASRTLVTFGFSMLMHLCYVAAVVLGHSIKWGWDSSALTMDNLLWLLVVMVQICANSSIIMLIVFACKKVLPAISGAVIFSFVSCNVLRNFVSDTCFRMTCFSLAQNSEPETLWPSLLFAVLTMLLSLTATWAVFRRAEIK